MKAFTTISALLGITYANPIQHIQYGSTGLRNVNRHSSNVMTNNDMHPMSAQVMSQRTGPIMDMVVDRPKPVVNPNQYLKKDNLGNYAFGYSTQTSEMSEVGNAQSKKGHFANIMADGKLRRVDYVADNQGFHILRDTADKTGRYIKREAEAEPLVQPDLIRTRMTSYMDSSSLRDDGKDLHDMSNKMMGQDMSSFNMPRNNQMSTMYRSSDMMNMMGRDMTSKMMNQGMSIGMMGHDMTNSVVGPDMSTIMMSRNRDIPMMGQTVYTNKMGQRGMTSNMGMPSLMTGQDMTSDMMGRNTMGQDMTSKMMEKNMVGQDMYSDVMDIKNKMMSSNIVMGQNQMTPLNRLNQRMQIETMPSQSRFF